MNYIFTVLPDGAVYLEEGDSKGPLPKEARRVIPSAKVARLLHRSHRHLYRLIQRGWLRPVAAFAGQHFFDAGEVEAFRRQGRSPRMPSLPRRLAPLFPEYDGRSLQPDRDADLILSRILERGDPAALRWAHRHFPPVRQRQFLRTQGPRLLSPRALHFWTWLRGMASDSGHRNWRQPGRELGGIV